MIGGMRKIDTFISSRNSKVDVLYYILNLGTDKFQYKVVFEFYSCEVHYDMMGNREIHPMVDHYEPSEIMAWYPDILGDIERYYNSHKSKLFIGLLDIINDKCKQMNREIKFLHEELEKNDRYSD